MSHELGALDAFCSFPEEAVAALSGLAVPKDLEAGDVLFREGDPGDVIYAVVSGEIEIRKGGRTLARLHVGRTVGEMALLEEETRSADAVATEATRLQAFDSQAFNAFLLAHPECGAHFFYETGREMSRRLRRTSEYLMTVFEIGRIVAAGHAVGELAHRIVERLLHDVEEAASGRALLQHPLAEDLEEIFRAGASKLDGEGLLAVAERHAGEPGFHDVAAGCAILGATVSNERGEVMGYLFLEKADDEEPFTVDQEIVLEAVAHQAEQGILAAWTREEQAARERLERHRQQGY